MPKKSMGSLYVISAPSGAGKTSLVSKLVQQDNNIVVSVSTTTREARHNEVEGVNYFFVDKDKFQLMISQNSFLEYATVFGSSYGTSKKNVELLLDDGKDVILEIDWQGARLVKKAMSNVTTIFVLPPSLTELNRRLSVRGSDTKQVIAKRMDEATNEMSHGNEFDYLVINDDFNNALDELHSIFKSQRLRTQKQQLTHSLLLKTLKINYRS